MNIADKSPRLAILSGVLFISAWMFAAECRAAEPPAPAAERRAELISLVRQDCGSCHGMTLKGGLGPALLPETLKDKPAISLKAAILRGLPGTAMPPWRQFLTDDEAGWIVANLQKGFPDGR